MKAERESKRHFLTARDWAIQPSVSCLFRKSDSAFEDQPLHWSHFHSFANKVAHMCVYICACTWNHCVSIPLTLPRIFPLPIYFHVQLVEMCSKTGKTMSIIHNLNSMQVAISSLAPPPTVPSLLCEIICHLLNYTCCKLININCDGLRWGGGINMTFASSCWLTQSKGSRGERSRDR